MASSHPWRRIPERNAPLRPEKPDCAMTDEDVEGEEWDYPIRHPDDWVVSGPLPKGHGPGRRFPNWGAAHAWAKEKYGDRLLRRVMEASNSSRNRWAFVIRGNRTPIPEGK